MTEDDIKSFNESIQAAMEPQHRKLLDSLGTVPDCLKGDPSASPRNKGGRPKGTNPGGRPKGFSGVHSKMPSALAQAFKKAGLDWKQDFALAIKNNKRERIKLWLKLLPYMITTSSRAKVRRWKGRPSKAALIALETLEGKRD